MLLKIMGWGLASVTVPDPEMRAEGLGRATGATYLGSSVPAALGDWRMDPGLPQTCFKSVCWVRMGRHLAASGLAGSTESASKESWQLAD